MSEDFTDDKNIISSQSLIDYLTNKISIKNNEVISLTEDKSKLIIELIRRDHEIAKLKALIEINQAIYHPDISSKN